jgi:RNA polymerase sigma-70 factor, ECF subfamily
MSQLPSDSRCRTDASEQVLLALVSTGDRTALEQLYVQYFACLAKFFQNMTLRTDAVEELINDTMFEVWKAGETADNNASVLRVIMRFAYSRVQGYFTEFIAKTPHPHRGLNDPHQSNAGDAQATSADFHIFLSKLPFKERAVVCLVYGSGCSRQESADVMEVPCDYIDTLLNTVRSRFRSSVSLANIDSGAGSI